jgi:hypothetical protein|eukprot:4995824-Prymnesium_polylepis.1
MLVDNFPLASYRVRRAKIILALKYHMIQALQKHREEIQVKLRIPTITLKPLQRVTPRAPCYAQSKASSSGRVSTLCVEPPRRNTFLDKVCAAGTSEQELACRKMSAMRKMSAHRKHSANRFLCMGGAMLSNDQFKQSSFYDSSTREEDNGDQTAQNVTAIVQALRDEMQNMFTQLRDDLPTLVTNQVNCGHTLGRATSVGTTSCRM